MAQDGTIVQANAVATTRPFSITIQLSYRMSVSVELKRLNSMKRIAGWTTRCSKMRVCYENGI